MTGRGTSKRVGFNDEVTKVEPDPNHNPFTESENESKYYLMQP